MILKDIIKIFYSDDEYLKLLGEILSNKTGRLMFRLLSEKEYYANELAKKLNITPSLTSHHLKKLVELGLIDIKNKQIIKKGVEHEFFKIRSEIFISKSTKEKSEEKGLLQRIFKDGIKFTSIIFGGILSFIIASNSISDDVKWGGIAEHPFFSENFLFSITISLFIVIIGLIIERIYFQIKNKKRM